MEAELKEIDKLYFPHEWQKRYPADQALAEHIKFMNTETEKFKKTVRCELDVPYGFLTREKYSIFGIGLPDDSPILIHVHGGYWQVKEINHNNQGFLASALHKHNIKLIALSYELCPDVTIKDIMIEVGIGIKRCLAYAERCKSRGIYLSGHSVGAHLIASLFSNTINIFSNEELNLIKGVFLSCGLYNISALTQTSINKTVKLTEDVTRELSPQYMNIICPAHISVHVIVAEYDTPVFIDQGKQFYEKLKGRKISVRFHLLKGIDHFNAIEKMTEDNFEITRLFIKEITLKSIIPML